MLIELKKDENSSSSGLEVSQMSFDMTKTAKLFHMLSSTMYSDKKSSIIRELSSNAHDSHYEAGKLDIPFKLTGPTFENPAFEIRDFGVGLTEEKAKKTILLYLGSDKDDRSDMVGGWGVGSKSPFAYSTTYEVIVYKDKQFAHFTCWKDETGLPNSAVIDRGETDEPDGVLMRVPVEAKDINEFNSALTNYMNWTNYNVELDIDGQKISPREPVITKEFGDYIIKVYKGNGYSKRRLVYGGFGYEMDQCVNGRYDYASDWTKLQQKLRYGYDVAFVIDTPNLVTFAMNREVLEQTEKSKEFVSKIISDLVEVASSSEKISKEVLDEINAREFDSASKFDLFVSLMREKLAELDNTLDTIFIRPNDQFGLDMYGLSKISTRGIHDLKTVKVGLSLIEDSFCVVYGRLKRVHSTIRDEFFANNQVNRIPLYVKAENVEQAKTILKEDPFFADYDIDKLDFYEINIPRTISKKNHTSRQGNGFPFITCTESKKRFKLKPNLVYVMVDKLKQHSDDMYVDYGFDILYQYVEIVPNKRTLEIAETEEYEKNFVNIEEFRKIAKTAFYTHCDNYFEGKRDYTLYRLRRFLDSIDTDKSSKKIREDVNKLRKEVSDVIVKMSVYSVSGYYQKKPWFKELQRKNNHSLINSLRKKAARIKMEDMKYDKIKSYISIHDLEKMCYNKDTIALELAELLKKHGLEI